VATSSWGERIRRGARNALRRKQNGNEKGRGSTRCRDSREALSLSGLNVANDWKAGGINLSGLCVRT
jgi:hypothetical protein